MFNTIEINESRAKDARRASRDLLQKAHVKFAPVYKACRRSRPFDAFSYLCPGKFPHPFDANTSKTRPLIFSVGHRLYHTLSARTKNGELAQRANLPVRFVEAAAKQPKKNDQLTVVTSEKVARVSWPMPSRGPARISYYNPRRSRIGLHRPSERPIHLHFWFLNLSASFFQVDPFLIQPDSFGS